MDASNELLLFLHIPKTAGTTVLTYLERQYKPGEVFRLNWEGPAHSQLTALKRHHRVMSGHMSFGLHRKLDRPCRYITLLRNPVDRIMSIYYFALTYPDMYLHETASRMTLAEFALSNATAELDNYQVRALSGKSAAPLGSITASDLRQAKQNLQSHFDVVGVQDDVNGFLSAVGARFGLPRLRIPPQNVTQNRPTLAGVPQAVKESIRRRNALDMELYQFVKSTLAPESAWHRPMRVVQNLSAAAMALLPALVPSFLKNATQPPFGPVLSEPFPSAREQGKIAV